MKNKILIIGIFFGLVLTSCQDFLEKYPHSDVAMDQAILTEDDVQTAINGVYNDFKSDYYYGRYFVVYPDVMTDEVASIIGFSNQLGILYKWTHTAVDDDIENMWAVMYSAIARANVVLGKVDGIEGDTSALNYHKGEALMARALAHFDLVRTFAKPYNKATASADLGIPYMKQFVTSEPARDNNETVYANIVADLKAAIGLMKTSPYTTDKDTYFSAAAAKALLARVYLYMSEWQLAINYADDVINNASYSYALCSGDDFTDMWLNDVGDEVIWKVGLTTTDAADKYIGYNYYNDSQGKPNPDYMPTDNFIGLYDKVKDIRYSAYFKTVETSGSNTLTLCYKYPTNPKFAAVSNANGSNMPKVLRLSEMYLICAEAYAELSQGALGWEYIRALRSARITSYNPTSDPVPASIKEVIFNERKKEMAFEGHLWFDYKRTGRGFTRQGRTATGNNKFSNDISDMVITSANDRWLYPIPQAEKSANAAMVQNDGY